MKPRRRPPGRFRVVPAGDVTRAINEEFDGRDEAPSVWLVVSSQVGDVRFVPAGYELSECGKCLHPTWINAAIVHQAERRGMVVISACTRCLKSGGKAS